MSTQLALGLVGAGLGAMVGMPGVGFAIGSTIGGLIDRPDGPSPGDLSAPKIEQGSTLPRVYGRVRVPVNPVWVSEFRATANETPGKGGPPEGSAGYTYSLDVLYELADGTNVIGITRVWINKKLVWTALTESGVGSIEASAITDAWGSILLLPGDSSQSPWSVYETAVGAADAVAYRHRATVGIADLQCGGSKTLPLVEVEVITAGSSVPMPVPGLLNYFEVAGVAANSAASLIGPEVVGAAGASVSAGTGIFPTAGAVFSAAGISGALGPTWRIDAKVMRTSASGSGAIVRFHNPVTGRFVEIGSVSASSGFRASYSSTSGSGSGSPSGGVGGHTASHPLNEYNFYSIRFDPENGLRFYLNDVYRGSFGATSNGWSGVEFTHYNIGGGGFAGIVEWVAFCPDTNVYVYAGGDPPAPWGTEAQIWTPGTVDLAGIVNAELAANPGVNLADYNTSGLVGIPVRGFTAAGTPAQTIKQLADAFYFDVVPGNPNRIVRRGGAVVGAIAYADTGAGVDGAGDPFSGLKRENNAEIAAVRGLQYRNILQDHETGFERSDRRTTDGPDSRNSQTNVVFEPQEAKGRVTTYALDARASAHTASFGLSDKYAALEPGDPWAVFDASGNSYRLRAVRLAYADGVRQVEWALDDTSALVQTGVTSLDYTPSITVVAPVDSALLALDIPILRDADDDAGAYAAVYAVGDVAFPGAVVRRSVDNLDFSELATTHPSEAVTGTASTVLGNWSGGYVWDEANSVTVALDAGQTLASASADALQLDRTLNVAAIGAHGRWELVRFRSATLISADTYTLSGLLRGVRGTEAHMASHAVGDRFVLLTSAGLRRMSGEVVDIGATRYLKAVTNGRPAASAASQAFVNAAVGLRPLSPTNLRAARDAANNITFTFTRRTRLAPRYGGSGGSYAPLGEATERYEIDVYASGAFASVVRTISATTETAAYSATEQTADGLTPGATVYTRTYQLSAAVGRGAYLQATA